MHMFCLPKEHLAINYAQMMLLATQFNGNVYVQYAVRQEVSTHFKYKYFIAHLVHLIFTYSTNR